MKPVIYLLLATILSAAMITRAHADNGELATVLQTARNEFDSDGLKSAHAQLEEAAEAAPEDFTLQLLTAKAALFRADLLRNQRMILDLEKKESKSIRNEQKSIAKRGVPFAKSALELADTNDQKIEASRVLGELYAHQITGMVSGMRYGSKSRDLIESALSIDPDDAECLRANGLMFLYNPPLTGGDVDKAVETFTRCTELDGSSDVYYVFLSQAFRKKGAIDDARKAAQSALELNPKNQDAANLLQELETTHE